MLINLSNHPIKLWSEKQISAAKEQYGYVTDLTFPHLDPTWDEEQIDKLAEAYLTKILPLRKNDDVVVHVMGEMTFCFTLIKKLQSQGITCVASTTNRVAIDHADGSQTSKFEFVKFRKY